MQLYFRCQLLDEHLDELVNIAVTNVEIDIDEIISKLPNLSMNDDSPNLSMNDDLQ